MGWSVDVDVIGFKSSPHPPPRSHQANYQRIVTPLMWAAYCGHAKVVRFLLECGAHIDQVRARVPVQ